MRKCYATALVLITWYLMLPPPVFPPVKDASGNYQVNSAAPISQWLTFKTLKSEAACKAQLKKMPSFYKCVKSDDPALKPRAAGASQNLPSTSTLSGAAASHMQ
jgi:hypothetical protein